MPAADRALVEQAPAKVNLTLRLLGRRADGYHDLESLVVFAAEADELKLFPGEPLALQVDGPTATAAGDVADNLVLKVARGLSERVAGLTTGRFVLTKRLPVAAGLGGGSADAAAALRLLARVNSLALDDARLIEVAGLTGADVPVCLDPRPRLMRGIGEVLSPVSLPTFYVALAFPQVAVPTADIFRAPELTRATPSAKMDVFSEGYGRNDLAPVTASRFPAVAATLQALSRASPQARMTGSGACVFATFPALSEAQHALTLLPQQVGGCVARTLAQHPLRAFA